MPEHMTIGEFLEKVEGLPLDTPLMVSCMDAFGPVGAVAVELATDDLTEVSALGPDEVDEEEAAMFPIKAVVLYPAD